MKLNPQQAPLYGDCVVTVLLTEDDKVEEDAVLYLVFSGSSLHHCASTRRISSHTLETITPGHDCCETVKVLLCASKEGLPVFVVAEEDFQFIQDEAYDAAQFLATSAGNQQALNFTRFLDRSGPPSADVNSLDEKVALAFRHLKLPAEWNVLGTNQTLHDGGPRETLMHFAVRLGLLRLTWFLLQKPGGRGALSIHNQEGATPVSLALERGYHKLHKLLTEENAGEPDSWSSLSYEIPCGDCSVRHHRELNVYTLTSEYQSHHEPLLPADSCSGHIFKLMNIQQQLMKTNLKEMDNCMPLTVTAQDLSGLPTAQDTDGSFLPCALVSTDSQQCSSPPADAESSPCCPGSTAGQIECSSDLSSVGKEENTEGSRRKESKGLERKEEEAEPTATVDSENVADPQSCLRSMSDCGGKGTEGLPSYEIRGEETGTKSAAVATAQESLSSGGAVLLGVPGMESGTAQHFSGGELVGSSTVDASVPETAGGTERGLVNPDTTTQKKIPKVGESTKERFENSNVSTAGASDVRDTKPVDKAIVPNCVSATSSLNGDTPAESLLALSNGETLVEKTAETETSRCCEGSARAADQHPLIIPAATNDKISDSLEADTPLANTRGELSPSDFTFPRPQKDVMPNQKSETNSSHVQSQSSKPPVCSTPGDNKPHAASACGQNAVTCSSALAAERCDDIVTQPGGTTAGLPHAQPPPTAVCSEGPQTSTVTPDPVRDTQEDVGFCPLEVSGKEGQARDLNLETSLTNMLEVSHHPPAVSPKAETEPAPDQAVTSGRTFSLAGGESVMKDDVLSLVPSQKEKGTATPEPHTATHCRDGGDWNGPDEQPLEDSAAGLFTASTAPDLQPSMGNASPVGFGGEQEGPCLSAAPEVLSVEGGTDSSLLHVGKAPLASDCNLTEEGKNLVVPESSAAQGQDDKFKTVIFSSIKEDTFPSGMLQEEQGTDAPGQELPEVQGEPSSAACAQDKALEHGNSRGTPSACLNAETKHNKEVAPPVSLVTEGGAAQSPVPPGASLAADLGQEAVGAEQSSSPLLPGLLPDGSKALNCNGSFAMDVGVKYTQTQGKTTACAVSGDMALDVAVDSALQGTVEARRKDLSHNVQDDLIPEVLRSQEGMTQGLPGALPDKGATDLQGVAPPEMVPLGWEKGKLEGADLSCSMGDSEGAQINDDARHVPLQPIARELPAERGLSTGDDKAPSRDGGTPSVPYAVSAKAGYLPKRADSIEEAASRIVDAVIERVKASGALLAEGEISHMPPASPSESGPGAEQLESTSPGKVIALLPGETAPMGSTREEVLGNPAGYFAGREEPEKIIRPVQGPEPATEMPDTKADDEVDFLSNIRESSVSEEVAVGNTATTPKVTRQGLKTQAINQESWCTIEPCPDAASLLAPTQSPECENFLDVGLGRECGPKHGGLKRESGSDSDLFHSPSEDMDSIVFSKPEEEQSVCDITGSSSSTDDTASLDRHSSHGSDVSLPQIPNLNRSRDQQSLDGFYSHGVGAEGRESESEPAGSGEMEEELDSVTEVPATCSVLRSSMRSLSPFRRHSWGPGKNAASDGEMNHRSSMRVLGDVVRRPPIHRRSFSLEGLAGGAGAGNKPSSSLEVTSANAKELRHPFSGEEQGDSLVSLSEEDLESGQREHSMFGHQTCHRPKQQGFNYCTSAISSTLTKSVSLMTISHPGLDNSRPFHTSASLTESITEESYSFLPQSPSKKDSEGKSGTKVSRTFSYIRNKMSSSKKSKEKEKEKEKVREKEKESKEKEKKVLQARCLHCEGRG